MIEQKLSRILPFTGLILAVYSVQRYSSFPLGNTIIWWGINLSILLCFALLARYSVIGNEDKQTTQIIRWYLIWNGFNILRGLFIAELYWDYKGLIEMGMALMIPLVVYLALDRERVRSFLAFFLNIAIPVSFLFLPVLPIGGWGWYVFPVSLMMLFFPALPIRGKIYVLVITALAAFGDVGTRSHTIKYLMPVVLLIGFYTTRNFALSGRLMKLAQRLLMVVPFLFFILALTGVFEIFKMDQYIKGEYVETRENSEGEIVEENLTVDTRTFLYAEVLQSALKYDYWLIGRSPARGNETVHFAHLGKETTGRQERLRNEVGVLNVFTWTGVVGVILYFLVFYKASFYAIFRSNNIYVKLIGLFVSFRWVYAWVEDYQGFDMNNFVIWLMIGMCFSSAFRKMSNVEIKLWIWGIFDSRYLAKYRLYTRKEFSKSI
ncbi:hypothetical protein [Sunxiuqinia rutila]|uniref:hypothetical protein n=1 Tax=Sunxiuqinia rutila TaxID=1397841 RepID=UPI003D364F7A